MRAIGARRSRLGAEEGCVGPGGASAAAGSSARGGRRSQLAGVLTLAALVALGLTGASGGTTALGQATIFDGLGFDTCEAPSPAALQAWLDSPYRVLGIYIGGANRACANAQLSPTWVAATEGLGWGLAPLYVGLQAPCVAQGGLQKIGAQTAASEGTAAADDAVADASELALPSGSPIYFDMEGYALNDPACTQTVQTFLSAWVSGLHAQDYLAGVYGSASSTMRDLQALATTSAAPDDVWIADWDGDTSVFGDPYLTDALWTNHQRIHQFSGGHNESYGGVTLNIDSDAVDAAVVSSVGGPVSAPTTPAPTGASTLSAAGSVATSDGVAAVSWSAGTFAQSVVVSLTPSLPAQPVAGFGSGGYGVDLQVQQTATTIPVSSFSEPLTIHIGPQNGKLAPMESSAGTTWLGLPELVGNLLPVGADAGYAREPDGSIEIVTKVPGYFALLPDTTPPPAPATLTGHFSQGTLVLHWPAAVDSNGDAVSYQVSLSETPLLTVSGETTAALRTFHPDGPSVYRVTASDAAGNISPPSPALVVLPTERPTSAPAALPAWTWEVFNWQERGSLGPRPKAPLPLPPWYWKWRAWRVSPFHLRS